MSDRPHILYVISDEHRYHAMSHAGDPNVRTPSIDRLASEGVSFTRAYANCPLCTPSRGTMFTGRHAHAGGVPGLWSAIHPASPTSAKELRTAGYHTAYFGKWHLGGLSKIGGAERLHPDGRPLRGFPVPTPERFRGGFRDWWGFEDTNDHFRCYYFPGDGTGIRFIDGYVTDGLTDMAIDYLRNYDRKAPLFMVVSVPPPHFPFEVPEKFLRLDPAGLAVRPNFAERPGRSGPSDAQPARPGLREDLAVYYAMIENLDENIGRLTDAVRELPRFENTLTVYLSDHGEFGGSHGRMARKEHPHEESVRIPMIWRWPGRIPAGRRPDDLASIADLMPTTLALAGVQVPDYCQGRDFSPLLHGEAFRGPGAVLLEMVDSPRWSPDFPNWRGVVTDRWKYAVYEDGAEVLFDLDADPFEMKNLADANHPHRSEMRETLLKLLRETGEPFFHLLLRGGGARG